MNVKIGSKLMNDVKMLGLLSLTNFYLYKEEEKKNISNI